MGQKVHPLGFRLGITQKHKNYWYTNPKDFAIWLQDANFIRNYLKPIFLKAGLINIEIRRHFVTYSIFYIKIQAADTKKLLNYNFPSLSKIPKRKKTLEDQLNALRFDLKIGLKKYYKIRQLPDPNSFVFKIYLESITNPYNSANFLAQNIVNDLERRKPFNKTLFYNIEKAKETEIKGLKIKISGRLNGIDKARTVDFQWGAVPLHTLRAKIDYSEKSAKTVYGLFGVKVWIFHGESLMKLNNL